MAKEPKIRKITVKQADKASPTREESVLLGNAVRQETWDARASERFAEEDLSKARKQAELDESSRMKNALRNARKKAAEKAAKAQEAEEAAALRDQANRAVNAKSAELDSLLASAAALETQIKDLKTIAGA